MIRVKTMPSEWREKVVKAHGAEKTKRTYKDKGNCKKTLLPRNLSFEAILELTNNGTHRIKEILQS